MQFDRSYISPYFVTNAEKMRVELEDPCILVHEKKLSGLQTMLPLLEAVVQTGKPLIDSPCGKRFAFDVFCHDRGQSCVAALRSRPSRRPALGIGA